MSNDWTPHSREFPCPVCGGHEDLPRGTGARCWGATHVSGEWTRCTRENFDGEIKRQSDYVSHTLKQRCWCGDADDGHGAQLDAPVRPPGGYVGSDLPPIDVLHAVFDRVIALSPLRDEHRDFYRMRDGDDSDIPVAFRYAALPTREEAREIVDTLLTEFDFDLLRRVPGFTPDRGRIRFEAVEEGELAALIPCYDAGGRIMTMVRHAVEGGNHKYQHLKGSTSDYYTVANVSGAGHPGGGIVYLVEGIHKAHVAALRCGISAFGIKGHDLREAHLGPLGDLGAEGLVEAFDADKFVNQSVHRGREKALTRLASIGSSVFTAVWESQVGKGLDDLYNVGGAPRLRKVWKDAELSSRAPYPAPPQALAAAVPLDDARQMLKAGIRAVFDQPDAHRGTLQLKIFAPGVGKTSMAAEAAIESGLTTRFLMATKEKCHEFNRDFPEIKVAVGRNKDNCEMWARVDAAEQRHLRVGSVICAACPAKEACTQEDGGYYNQFKRGRILVAPTELMFNREFMVNTKVLVLDDPELARALVRKWKIKPEQLKAVKNEERTGAVAELMAALQNLLQENGDYDIANGAQATRVWDRLARGLGSPQAVSDLVRRLPRPEEDDELSDGPPRHFPSLKEIEATAPKIAAPLIAALTEELPLFERGADFVSRLQFASDDADEPRPKKSKAPDILVVWELREPRRTKSGRPRVANMAVLALDATPSIPVYERLSTDLTVVVEEGPRVAWPESVKVIQYAHAFYGKRQMTERGGKRRKEALDTLSSVLVEKPRAATGVITHKALVETVVKLDVPKKRVLHFGGLLGLNRLEDIERLIILGSQQPSTDDVGVASALYSGENAIQSGMVLRAQPYEGYAAPDGQGRQVDVIDVADKRQSALFRTTVDGGLYQAVHRGRPHLRDDTTPLEIIIIGAKPIPGIPVHDLVEPGGSVRTLNEHRQATAKAKLWKARNQILENGGAFNRLALARVAEVNPKTVAKYWPELTEGLQTARGKIFSGVATPRGSGDAPSGESGSDLPEGRVSASEPPTPEADSAAGGALDFTGWAFAGAQVGVRR